VVDINRSEFFLNFYIMLKITNILREWDQHWSSS